MIPIDQTIVDPKRGDCMQACVASILEVPLGAIPNFSLAPDGMFHHLFEQTMYAYGWILESNAIHDGVVPWKGYDINGHFICSVPSRLFDCCTHAVVINDQGVVVHDPSPSKAYQGEELFNISRIHNIRGQRYHYFHTFQSREDEDWKNVIRCIVHHEKKKQHCRAAFDKSVERCSDSVDL